MDTETKMDFFRKKEAYAVKKVMDALKKGNYKVEISDEMIKRKLVQLRDGRTYLPKCDEVSLSNTFWRIIVCGFEFTIDFCAGGMNYGSAVRSGSTGSDCDSFFQTDGLFEECHKLPEFRIPEYVQYATLDDLESGNDVKCKALCDLILAGKFTMQHGEGKWWPKTITIDGLSFAKRDKDSEWEQVNPNAYDFGDYTPILLQAVFDDVLSSHTPVKKGLTQNDC